MTRSGSTSSTRILFHRTMSARCRSAGHTGTHCWHCVQAFTKSMTCGSMMCVVIAAAFSCAMVTKCLSGSGQASRQSLQPMQAMTSRSTSCCSSVK